MGSPILNTKPVMICLLSFQKEDPQFGLYPTELYTKVSFHALISLFWHRDFTSKILPGWQRGAHRCCPTLRKLMPSLQMRMGFLFGYYCNPNLKATSWNFKYSSFLPEKQTDSVLTSHHKRAPSICQERFRNSACFSTENYRVQPQAN